MLVTDVFQFVIKMTMVIVLAVAACRRGGRHRLDEDETGGHRCGAPGSRRVGSAVLFPISIPLWMPMITFLVYISVNWWATWYPGAEPGGGGYRRAAHVLRQRRKALAARDAVVQHRALRGAAVAVDPGRAGLGDPLPAISRIRRPAISA